MGKKDIHFKFKDLQNDYVSHNMLVDTAQIIQKSSNIDVILDFTDCKFVSANLFAVLGCIIESYIKKNNISFTVRNLSPKIKEVIQKNKFCKLLNWSAIQDDYNTTLPYYKFNRNQIDEFEKYILLYILNRSNMPNMSQLLKTSILNNFLEIYNNVIDHTQSEYVFTCGQFFPKKSLLYFTIVDVGESIYENVKRFHDKKGIELNGIALKWAMEEGNTTRVLNASGPGGLGFSLIMDFIRLNKGCFYVISNNECFEFNGKGERYKRLNSCFYGTMVTMAFNLKDTSKYILRSENEAEDLVF